MQTNSNMMIALVCFFYFLTPPISKAQTTKPVEWGPDSHSCRVAVLNSPVTVKAGDAVDVDIVVRHAGPEEAFITEVTSHAYDMFSIDATLNGHTRAEPTAFAKVTEYICNGVVRGLMKNPEELKRTVRVSRLIDMSRTGKYKIKIIFTFETEIDGQNVKVEAESPPFVVDVKEDTD